MGLCIGLEHKFLRTHMRDTKTHTFLCTLMRDTDELHFIET